MPNDEQKNGTSGDPLMSLASELEEVAAEEKRQMETQLREQKITEEERRRIEEKEKIREQQRRYREEQELLRRSQTASADKTEDEKSTPAAPAESGAPSVAPRTAEPRSVIPAALGGALVVALAAFALYFFWLGDRSHSLDVMLQSNNAAMAGARLQAKGALQIHDHNQTIVATRSELQRTNRELGKANTQIASLQEQYRELAEQLQEVEEERDELRDASGARPPARRRRQPSKPSGPAAPDTDIFKAR